MNDGRRWNAEIHGPFMPEYRVTLDCYRVPYLTVNPNEDGTFWVTIDNRFGIADPVSREEFDRWMPILANAMAVAAGYSSHGECCVPINPFKLRMSKLEIGPPELTVVDGDKKP